MGAKMVLHDTERYTQGSRPPAFVLYPAWSLDRWSSYVSMASAGAHAAGILRGQPWHACNSQGRAKIQGNMGLEHSPVHLLP